MPTPAGVAKVSVGFPPEVRVMLIIPSKPSAKFSEDVMALVVVPGTTPVIATEYCPALLPPLN